MDGRIDEVAWQSALVLHLDRELQPKTNAQAPVATTVYLAYDDNSLYAAFRAEDPDPKQIRARLTDRDAATDDDFVGLGLDTFNDERRGFLFFVNPLGVQMDRTRTEIGATQEDDAWDAIWSSAGRIDGQGYTVEIAIPFTSLRFQRSAGDQTWASCPTAAIRAASAMSWWRSRPIRTTSASSASPQDDRLRRGHPGAQPELDPTVTALRTEARERRGGPRGAGVHGGPRPHGALGITPNLVLSGTINPDFSQVEADVAQLDINTQFALFYPEKRPFFLEGDDFFDTLFDAVHTRIVADPSGFEAHRQGGRTASGCSWPRTTRPTSWSRRASSPARPRSRATAPTPSCATGGTSARDQRSAACSPSARRATPAGWPGSTPSTASPPRPHHRPLSRLPHRVPDAFAEQLAAQGGLRRPGLAPRLCPQLPQLALVRPQGRSGQHSGPTSASCRGSATRWTSSAWSTPGGGRARLADLDHRGQRLDATKEKDGGLLLEEELEYWLSLTVRSRAACATTAATASSTGRRRVPRAVPQPGRRASPRTAPSPSASTPW